jgi:hypothetical protein
MNNGTMEITRTDAKTKVDIFVSSRSYKILFHICFDALEDRVIITLRNVIEERYSQ